MKVYYVAGNNWWTDTTSGSIASAKRTEAKMTDHWYSNQIKQCSNKERNFQMTRRYRSIT